MTIESPCIKLCKIDPTTRLCTGCLRSLEEIGGWRGMSDADRRQVMAALPERADMVKNAL